MWDARYEAMPRGELQTLQLERVRKTVELAYASVPFYRASFDCAGVRPEQINTLDDLRRFPFIRKVDFREGYPWSLLAVPRERLREVHASSGTTGALSLTGYTDGDLAVWTELVARVFGCAGARPGDLVLNAYGYGLFTGGLGFHYGAQRFGCTVIPMSSGNTLRQIAMLHDLRPDILCCTPSYALHLAEAWRESGFVESDLSVRAGIFGAEPWTGGMRREIEAQMRLRAIDVYGLAEAIGPGVSCECVEEQKGLHVFEDHFIVECIDPRTDEPVPDGAPGELVFTSLTKEALPIIRYRTGDISALDPTPCSCGRTVRRMARISGRTDDMLVVRGINIFPSDVEAILLAIPELSPQYRLVVDREKTLDAIEVHVEGRDPSTDGAEALAAKVATIVRNALGISVQVSIVAAHTIPRSEGKALRVVDRRKL